MERSDKRALEIMSRALRVLAVTWRALTALSALPLAGCAAHVEPDAPTPDASGRDASSNDALSDRTDVTGTVDGYAFDLTAAVAIAYPNQGLTLVLAGVPLTCAYGNFFSYKNTVTMEIYFYEASVPPGTYSITADATVPIASEYPPGDYKQVYVFVHDWSETCQDLLTSGENAQQGNVVLEQVTPAVVGSIDLTFASGHLTGTLDARVCPNTLPEAGVPACL